MTQSFTPPNQHTDHAAPNAPQLGHRTLYRDPNGMLGGVAGGIANHAGLDPSIIRLALVLSTVIAGIGPILYIAAWMIVPMQPTQPQPFYGPVPSAQY